MKRAGLALLAVMLLVDVAWIHAQQRLTLEFRDTRVTLDAQNVPVRQILEEWARLGGTRIVNGDKVTGTPVTLQLTDVPERQALEIVLRSVSGYMLAARPPGTPGASAVDRILILATSAAPQNPPPPTPRPAPVARRVPAPQARPPVEPPVADPDDQLLEQPELSADTPAIVAPGGMPPGFPPPAVPGVMAPAETPAATAPGMRSAPGVPNRGMPASGRSGGPAGSLGTARPGMAPPPQTGQPAQQSGAIPSNPFGLTGGSNTPGVAVPPTSPGAPFGPGATTPTTPTTPPNAPDPDTAR